MDRARSRSRRPSSRHGGEHFSPTSSRSRSSSTSSYWAARDRPRSPSRGTQGNHRRGQQHASSSSSNLPKSAGVLAGIGIVALVAHKLWPKKGKSETTVERQQRRGSGGGGGNGRRRSSAQEHVPRGRDVDRRGQRQTSNMSSYDHGQGRYAARDDESGYYLREPRRGDADLRSWQGESTRSQTQPSLGYGRRY